MSPHESMSLIRISLYIGAQLPGVHARTMDVTIINGYVKMVRSRLTYEEVVRLPKWRWSQIIWKMMCTIKRRFTDSRLIRTLHYYEQFALSLGKESPHIFSKFNSLNTDTPLIRTVCFVPGERKPSHFL